MYKGKARNSISALRHRITVQVPIKTTDQGQEVVSWLDVLTSEPADYEYVRGYQTANGRQVEEGVDCVFTVRYSDVYSPVNRIQFDGEEYGVVFVRPTAGRNMYMELHCKVIK